MMPILLYSYRRTPCLMPPLGTSPFSTNTNQVVVLIMKTYKKAKVDHIQYSSKNGDGNDIALP